MENPQISVLLVEDDEEDALLVREWLDEAHTAKFAVAWVRTFAATLQAVSEQHYDVILVDYRLGPENGVELIRQLVAGDCQAPIILLTGVGSYLIDTQAMDAGATDYLPKAQLTTELLERSILHALSHKRTQVALQERTQLASLNADVNAALVQGESVQEMLQRCTEAIVRHLDVAFARIWVLDKHENTLVLQASAGKKTRLDGPYSRIPVGKFKIGRIAQERRPHLSQVQITDLQKQDRKGSSAQSFSFAGYPLITKDDVVGVIALFARQPLTQVTLQKIAVIADTLVIGIGRRQAQDELAASELRWRTLTELLPQFAWTCDATGTCDYMNTQWSLYSGVPLDELLGWGWLQTLHPDDSEMVRNRWLATVNAEEHFEVEFRIRSKEGEYYWFQSRALPLQDPSSGSRKWFGVTLNIHEQKIFHENLQKSHDELEQYVQERTVELKETNEALRKEIAERVRAEEALRRSERFSMLTVAATKLAHEIGNPLNGLSTTVQLMDRFSKKRNASDGESLDEFLQDLKTEIARLQSLVANWRSLSNIGRLELRPYSLPVLISELLRSQAQLYVEHGVTLQEHFPSDLPMILADANRVTQAILNLTKNALEVMPQGGTLTLKAAHQGDRVVLHISDTGRGVPEGINVFEPFVTTKEGGSGLGLSIVQEIMRAHGGTITYTSKTEEGTTFTLTFAIAPPENGTDETSPSSPQSLSS